MGKKIICLLLSIVFLCLFLIYGVPKIGPVHFEFEPTHTIYYGDIITAEDFKCFLVLRDGTQIEIPIESINKEFAEPEITFNTKLGTKIAKIDLINVKSFGSNLSTDYIQAGAPFIFPEDFQMTLNYEDGKQIIFKEKDLQIKWENKELCHGKNIFTAQWRNITMVDSVNALAHPIIQSDEYPMYYYDLDTSIEITKERFHDTDCFVAHVITTDPLALKTTFGPNGWGSHCYMSDVMEYRHAILMINGDYTDCGYGGWGPIVRDSEVVNFRSIPNAWGKTLGIKNDGHFYYVQSGLYDEIRYNDLRDAWTFNNGFTILDGKRIIKNDGGKHPRTFVGEVLRDDEKLEYYLVVADGRREDSRGFCHDDESAFLFEKGCYIAYNLDGGGSSEMMFDGKILNTPSDGHERLDHDFIYFALWDGVN